MATKKRKKKPAKREKGRKSVNKGRVRPPRRGRPKTGKAAIKTAEKHAQVLELRKQGKSLQEIADALGYSHPSGAHQALTRAIEQMVSEPAEDVKALELLRLDGMFSEAWKKVEAGDLALGDFVLRLMARRAKLLGLDAPEKMEALVKNEGADFSKMDGEQIKAHLLDLWRQMPEEVRDILKGADDVVIVEDTGDAGDGSRAGG